MAIKEPHSQELRPSPDYRLGGQSAPVGVGSFRYCSASAAAEKPADSLEHRNSGGCQGIKLRVQLLRQGERTYLACAYPLSDHTEGMGTIGRGQDPDTMTDRAHRYQRNCGKLSVARP
jgi:hypothetical protein